MNVALFNFIIILLLQLIFNKRAQSTNESMWIQWSSSKYSHFDYWEILFQNTHYPIKLLSKCNIETINECYFYLKKSFWRLFNMRLIFWWLTHIRLIFFWLFNTKLFFCWMTHMRLIFGDITIWGRNFA